MLEAIDRRVTDWLFYAVATGYVVFSLADLLTTSYALQHGGRERNPIASSLYATHGFGALVAFKLAVVAVIVVTLKLMPRRPAVWVGTALAATMAIVVTANVGAIAPR